MSNPGNKTTPPLAEAKPLPQSTVYLMAITVTVSVANIYYIQPLLAESTATEYVP